MTRSVENTERHKVLQSDHGHKNYQLYHQVHLLQKVYQNASAIDISLHWYLQSDADIGQLQNAMEHEVQYRIQCVFLYFNE